VNSIDVGEAVGAYIVIALVLVLTGWCRFQINGRRFRRRTIGGGQRFPSYGAAVITQLWEGLVMSFASVFMGAAVIMAIGLAVLLYRYA
jgi:ABC-type phosphate/phosphonate transport system permease subunit